MSKTRLFEAVKRLDLQETKEILEAKPELLKVWNDQGRNLLASSRGLVGRHQDPQHADRRGADKAVVVGETPFLACWGWKRFKAAKALALKGKRNRKFITAIEAGGH